MATNNSVTSVSSELEDLELEGGCESSSESDASERTCGCMNVIKPYQNEPYVSDTDSDSNNEVDTVERQAEQRDHHHVELEDRLHTSSKSSEKKTKQKYMLPVL